MTGRKKHLAPKPRLGEQWFYSGQQPLGIVAGQPDGTWAIIKSGTIVSTHPTRESAIAALTEMNGEER